MWSKACVHNEPTTRSERGQIYQVVIYYGSSHMDKYNKDLDSDAEQTGIGVLNRPWDETTSKALKWNNNNNKNRNPQI